MKEKVLVIDFGSQYTQLIARKVREINIYCEIYPYHKLPNIANFKAIILSGSPFSVLEKKAPLVDLDIFKDKPVLAICYSAQLIAKIMGCKVSSAFRREYGRAHLKILKPNPLFRDIPTNNEVWMSHSDTIEDLQLPLIPLASTKSVDNAAYKIKDKPIYGIQFHPEVNHSKYGQQLLKNFLIEIAQIQANWTSINFIDENIEHIKNIVGKDSNVIIGLSGGVDSSVAAMLISKAIGTRLHCIFVNNGLLRKNEFEDVLESYQSLGLNVKGINSEKVFLDALKGISDPEEKRKIIGKIFIEEFEREAQLIDNVGFLAQGTIYPDVIESTSVDGPSVTIKSHHNVGGLPKKLNFKLLEPLKYLFKDEVRRIGTALKIPNKILSRHPFPGPGLAIRIIGKITLEDLITLKEVDHIFIEALKKHHYYDKVWQAGAILLPIKTVGVMGDERTYQKCVALRAVESTDGMTADWVHLPYALLQEISNEIINKVQNINRVVLDISSKPPATIEWE